MQWSISHKKKEIPVTSINEVTLGVTTQSEINPTQKKQRKNLYHLGTEKALLAEAGHSSGCPDVLTSLQEPLQDMHT